MGYSNPYLQNFGNGKIYGGKWKQFCNPGLNCYSCPAASLACPIGALQAVGGSMNFSFSFYVAGFLLAAGVLLGRFVCGYLCPFGLIQELIYKLPTPKRSLWKGIRYVKYVFLAVFVLILPVAATNYMGMGKPAFCQFICPAGTLEGGLPLLDIHPGLRRSVGGLFSLKMLILAVTVAGCMWTYRFFCRAACPLGAVYGLMNKVSLYRLEVDRRRCIDCGRCQKACKMDVDPVKTPNSAECIRCGECMETCPADAIQLGFRCFCEDKKTGAKENGCRP